ncbi:helix-turn-helix domain-containing protein [Nocardioides sp. MAHUQ-72]|uniref:helix-turn-helix domain-containing protein n=1 Tax=unclassified Nocardioides TaxID=2615069 RepID=UPI00361499E7
MPRLSEPVDDKTPLTASRIDVAARIGWLLRIHRTVGGLSLREMSAALKDHGVSLSAATLSRIESEGQRSPAALDGYARVLGLPEGSLRAPVDTVCRTFPYAPAAPPPPASRSLDRFSRAYEAVDVADPTGGAWLELARQHADDGGFGLPVTLMAPLVHRLCLETARSVRTARFTRVEALVTLRLSAYDDLVDDVVRAVVSEPDSRNFWDVMDALTYRPTPSLLAWGGGLLSDPSVYRMRGASYALQNMLVVGGLGLDDWSTVVPLVEAAWRDAGDDPERTGVLKQLWAALPPPLQERYAGSCRPDPAPTSGPTVWVRTRQNPHYVYAETLARAACAQRGLADEPMLARLLFEAMFDPRGVRMSAATLLLGCSPFGAAVVRPLLEEQDSCPDETSRVAATRVAAYCSTGEDLPGVGRLLESPDGQEFLHGLTFVSRGERPLPDASLVRGLSGGEMSERRTLYALGMTGDPRLHGIEADRSLPTAVRGGARWWLEQGARIDV